MMRMGVLLQQGGLNEVLQAVRGRMQQGDSWLLLLKLLAFMVVLVLLTHYLTKHLQGREKAAQTASPTRLFRGLLQQLGLTAVERRLLESVARQCKLANPSVLLLSPVSFDRYVCGVGEGGDRPQDVADGASDSQAAVKIRDVLFPSVEAGGTEERSDAAIPMSSG